MAFSYSKSIMPMSVLRSDPDKVKRQLKNSPVVITNKGTPDFGVCDLETLEIAVKIKEKQDLLKERLRHKGGRDIAEVLHELDKKYGYSS